MIPFEVDPTGYYLLGACLIIFFVSLILYCVCKETRMLWLIYTIVFFFGCVITMLLMLNSFVYTDTITICKHDSALTMTVIDTNENVYYIQDMVTKFKVIDNKMVKAKIKISAFGDKYIYSIDAPITCGNQTCGVGA
jgi:hypothetical protein